MQSRLNTVDERHLSACPACDLLIDDSGQVKEGYVSECPRCRHVLEHPTRLSIRNNFLCVVTGLIFYFPAMLLPVMKFTMLGQTQAMSVFNCVQALFVTDNRLIAMLVFFTLMFVPLAKMMLIIFISTRFFYHVESRYLAPGFKWYLRLNTWAMLDIFMLSMMVAAIKLNEDAELEAGLGLYAFIVLLFVSAIQAQLLNKKLMWSLIEHHGK